MVQVVYYAYEMSQLFRGKVLLHRRFIRSVVPVSELSNYVLHRRSKLASHPGQLPCQQSCLLAWAGSSPAHPPWGDHHLLNHTTAAWRHAQARLERHAPESRHTLYSPSHGFNLPTRPGPRRFRTASWTLPVPEWHAGLFDGAERHGSSGCVAALPQRTGVCCIVLQTWQTARATATAPSSSLAPTWGGAGYRHCGGSAP